MAITISPDVIRALPLFAGMSLEEQELLFRAGRIRACNKGETLFLQGEPVTHFYVICRGTLQLFRTTLDGHEVTPDILIAGDTFGESEIAEDRAAHTLNARAVEETTLFEVPMPWMRRNLKDFDHLSLKMLALVSRSLERAHLDVEHQATMTAAQLVGCFLQQLCEIYGFDPKGFDLPYSKTLIASRLGMQLETLSRALAKLREHGIHVEGNHVSFYDMPHAQSFACGSCCVTEECPTRQSLEKKMHPKAADYGS